MWTSRADALFLEFVNAFWAICTTWALIYFSSVVIRANGGLRGMPTLLYKSAQRFAGNRATHWEDGANAWCALFLGETMRAWSMWAWRRLDLEVGIAPIPLSLIISATAVVCIIKVYSPAGSNGRMAFFVVVGGLAFASISTATHVFSLAP